VINIRQGGEYAYERGMNEAGAVRKQGQQALTGSIIGGATSFLGSVAGVGMDYGWWGPGINSQVKTFNMDGGLKNPVVQGGTKRGGEEWLNWVYPGNQNTLLTKNPKRTYDFGQYQNYSPWRQ
jgi:hypothetical protein